MSAPDPVPVLTADEREMALALANSKHHAFMLAESYGEKTVATVQKSERIAAHPDTALAHALLAVVRNPRMDEQTDMLQSKAPSNLLPCLIALAERRVEASR